MLVLSRRVGEAIVIDLANGERITITVVAIRPDKVRLGFDAPDDVPVNRQEIRQAIRAGKSPRQYVEPGHNNKRTAVA